MDELTDTSACPRWRRGIAADRNGELDAVLLAEHVQPVQNGLDIAADVDTDDLAQVVDEHVGDVIVAGIQAADEAAQRIVVIQLVFLGVDQTDMIVDIVHHIAAGLDANDVAGLVLSRIVDQFDELLGLARALNAHNKSDHIKSLLLS